MAHVVARTAMADTTPIRFGILAPLLKWNLHNATVVSPRFQLNEYGPEFFEAPARTITCRLCRQLD